MFEVASWLHHCLLYAQMRDCLSPLPVANVLLLLLWATLMTEFSCPCNVSFEDETGPAALMRGSQNCTVRSLEPCQASQPEINTTTYCTWCERLGTHRHKHRAIHVEGDGQDKVSVPHKFGDRGAGRCRIADTALQLSNVP